jgi:uncharacterized protein YbcV (DUF1398 family)
MGLVQHQMYRQQPKPNFHLIFKSLNPKKTVRYIIFFKVTIISYSKTVKGKIQTSHIQDVTQF